MALSHRGRERAINYWPGFVDALSTLLLVFTFLLSVFVIAQFFLTQEITGKDNMLARLNSQLKQLSELLSLERANSGSLEDQLAALRANLKAAETERDQLRQGAGDSDRILSTQLENERNLSQKAASQVEILNQQIAALRRQLAALEEALDASEKRNKDSQTKIVDLGQRLNIALAQRVQELQRYRSEFFGRLREILGNRPDIRIVGDRFVFQSEVLFDAGSASLRPEALPELDKFVSALREIEKKIPTDIAWILRVRRSHGRSSDRNGAISIELGIILGPLNFGGAIYDFEGRCTPAPCRSRIWRIPAARPRHKRGCLSPQSPH